MADFSRKDNYSDRVIKRIRDIKKNHGDILFVPNKDCIKAYYKGLVLFEKITDNCENLAKKCEDQSWDKNHDAILREIGSGMPRDKERRTQQIIALRNMSFERNKYSVCGFETTISTKDVKIPGKAGAPEIDMVILRPSDNPKERSIILVEYKCKGSSMLEGKQNIECHYRDYLAILNSDVMDNIKVEIIKSYRLLCRINGIETSDEEFDAKDYRTQIAFLFVDRVVDENGNVESYITEDDYSNAMSLFEKIGVNLNEVLYLRFKTPEEVNLNNWRAIKKSRLRLTE